MNPSLGCDSPLDLNIKNGLLCNLFTLIGVNPSDQRDVDEAKVNKVMFAYASAYGDDNKEINSGKKMRSQD